MENDNIIACICEGSAEQAIMDILLNHDVLKFQKDKLLDEKIIRARSGAEFEKNYLRKHFKSNITVYRILDSRKENFKLGTLYKDKVDVINVITAPEIEMLIIHNENKYDAFKKSRKKPSDYCKQDLKIKKVKSYKFIEQYFSDVDVLMEAIQIHKKKAATVKGEVRLADLLK